VGAVVNKKPDEPLREVIKKSLWQGALGGYVTFESKRILREVYQHNKREYVWAAKLVNSFGTSIKENSALNKDFWEKWHINIGFNRLEFNFKDEFSVDYKLMPVAFAFTVDAFVRYKFEFSKSLQAGAFIFSHAYNNGYAVAFATAGIIVYNRNYINEFTTSQEILSTATHEIIHLYQSNDFSIFNTYFEKPLTKWSEKSKTFDWVDKYLYPEFHYLILRPAYLLENININDKYDNFFEQEAKYYSTGY
ncbi:MAG: hypothetical protein ACPHT9_02860, partial [Flavobacteriaceae bacterium]